MKKLLAAAWALLCDIDIRVTLSPDGSARIVEVWDVVVTSGTEWFGDIVVFSDILGRATRSVYLRAITPSYGSYGGGSR